LLSYSGKHTDMPLPKKHSCECIDAERPWGVSWVY